MDDHYFVRSCTLEAQLELERKARWELQQLLEEAANITFAAGLTADNTDWYLRTRRALGKENNNGTV